MHIGGVFNIFGKLLILLSLFLMLPIPFSIYFNDGMEKIFLLCAGFGALAGFSLLTVFLPEKDMGYRDGFLIVVLSWLGLALLGAMPFYFSGQMNAFVDCWFESMSGFTTTGSTVLSTVEILPKSVLFWRATTHWLGGMGIIVLSLAILPLLGFGGTQLYQAEMPGPTKDRLAPRIQDTARILWSVYFLLTAIETILLMLGGLGFFDAVCHSFATLATGGFSTHSASVGHFQSSYIDAVVIVFMFLAGVNFTLHYQGMIKGKVAAYWKNEEFRLYCAFILASILVVVLANNFGRIYSCFGKNIRDSVFQVVSIITTTGFGTADFDKWPSVTQILLVALMFIGGCAGSTGGGIKVVRILLFFKYARTQLHTLVHPKSVSTIKVNGVRVPREVKVAIIGFFSLYFSFFVLACLLVGATGVDIVSGVTAVVATLNNIGPGLLRVGPIQHYGHLPAFTKAVLSFCMLAGRLELYTLAVLFTPAFWSMARKPRYRWQLRTKTQKGQLIR
ncbi:MAG: TrkH family potassium uptake protein [Deltaproteobacteria bacterium]